MVCTAGCGGGQRESEPVKIGLIMDFGGPADNGRNYYALKGLKQVQNEYGNKVRTKAFEVAADSSNAEYLIRLLAAEDYKLIFFFSNSLGTKADELASTYPQTNFVCMDSALPCTESNMQRAAFDETAAGRAAGMLAGLLAKDGQVAYFDNGKPLTQSHYGLSFEIGLHSIAPEVKVQALKSLKGEELISKSAVQTVSSQGVLLVYGSVEAQMQALQYAAHDNLRVITIGADPVLQSTAESVKYLAAYIFKDCGWVVRNNTDEYLNNKFETGTVMYRLNKGITLHVQSNVLDDSQKKSFDRLLQNINNK